MTRVATLKHNRAGHPYADQPAGSNFPLRLTPPKNFKVDETPQSLPTVIAGGLIAVGAGSILSGAFMLVADVRGEIPTLAALAGLVFMAGGTKIMGDRYSSQANKDDKMPNKKLQEVIYFDDDDLIIDHSFRRFPQAFKAARCRLEIMPGGFLKLSDDIANTYIGTFMDASELPMIKDMIDYELDHFRTMRPVQAPPQTRRPPTPPSADFA